MDNYTIGIGLAFVAMLCWGFGDFLIQKSTRKIGNWETLFIICGFGTLVLLPFVWKNIPELFAGDIVTLAVLFGGALVLLIAALLDFEALRVGKISIVEPIWSLEIPAATILAFLILGERVTTFQTVIIVLLIIGLMLVSLKERYSVKKFFVEKGVVIAFFSAIVMGVANFFVGWGARVSDPLMVNFIINIFITVATGIYLLQSGKLKKTFKDLSANRALLLPMAISDNAAWIAFAFAMSLAPIAIAVALSESYIIVAVLLGLFINREHLQQHQKFGLIMALISAIVLASVAV
jgi:drug/metabolite transporter (DMT)-like permease